MADTGKAVLVSIVNERSAGSAAGGRNECPNPACDRLKPREKAFCLPCWRRLPLTVQSQVWRSYRDRDLFEHVDFLIRLGRRLAAGTGEWPEP